MIEFVKVAKKFCIALIAALAILATALSDNVISTSEWIQIGVAFAGAAGVYQFKND